MKNRMRQLRTCGSVRGEGREALTYSEPSRIGIGRLPPHEWTSPANSPSRPQAAGHVFQ
jgi:hypothetical protein